MLHTHGFGELLRWVAVTVPFTQPKDRWHVHGRVPLYRCATRPAPMISEWVCSGLLSSMCVTSPLGVRQWSYHRYTRDVAVHAHLLLQPHP